MPFERYQKAERYQRSERYQECTERYQSIVKGTKQLKVTKIVLQGYQLKHGKRYHAAERYQDFS